MDGDDRAGPLQDYRVIDLTDRYGVLGTRILAGLGAEVIRVEPPGGDPMRRMGQRTRTPAARTSSQRASTGTK